MTMHYSVLAIDEGKQQVLRLSTDLTTPLWCRPLSGLPLARDLHQINATTVLAGFDRGFFTLNPQTGEIGAVVECWEKVSSAVPQEDGTILLCGVDLGETPGIYVLTVTAGGTVLKSVHRPGEYVRMLRPTATGTYLLCCDDHVLETDSELQELRRFSLPGFRHVWQAERLNNSHTLVSGGYACCLVLFDQNAQLLASWGSREQLPEQCAPHFYASCARLGNGSLLVTNWQGHGPDQGHKGPQLFEFNAEHQLARTWSWGPFVSSLQGLLVLQEA